MELVGSDDGTPSEAVEIVDCGELPPAPPAGSSQPDNALVEIWEANMRLAKEMPEGEGGKKAGASSAAAEAKWAQPPEGAPASEAAAAAAAAPAAPAAGEAAENDWAANQQRLLSKKKGAGDKK